MEEFQPSLGSRAIKAFTVSLWQRADLFDLPEIDKGDKVIQFVRNMCIPARSKEEIFESIRPVRQELNRYFELTNANFFITKKDLYEVLAWTSIGMIDTQKTADNIINSGLLKLVDSFKLACINCSTEHIYKLWSLVQSEFGPFEKDSDECSKYFLSWASKMFGYHPTVMFWVYHLSQGYQFSKAQTQSSFVYRSLFEAALLYSFRRGLVPALLFLNKYSNFNQRFFVHEASASLRKSHMSHIPIFLFLLSDMDKATKEKFFKSNLNYTLVIFLEWPLREFFCPVVEKLGPQLQGSEIEYILPKIIHRIRIYKNEAPLYKYFLTVFWQHIPFSCKSLWVSHKIELSLSLLLDPKSGDNALKLLFGTESLRDLSKHHDTLMNNTESLLEFLRRMYALEDFIFNFDFKTPVFDRVRSQGGFSRVYT